MSEQLISTPGVFGDNGNFLLERELGAGGMGGDDHVARADSAPGCARRREAALQGDGRYSDQAMQAAFADGCRVLRRMREREPREPHEPPTPKLSADRIGWAGDAAAA